MTSRDLSHEPALETLLGETLDALADTITLELRDVVPDFAAVVEAAHARDPQAVPRASLDEALALAPVVALGSESSQRLSLRGHAELNALVAAARSEVDDELAALRRRGWPPVPVPKASPPKHRGLVLWAAAAAAVLLFAIASPMLAARFGAAPDNATQAPWWQRSADSTQDAVPREPPAPARERKPSLAEPPTQPEPTLEPTPTPTPEPITLELPPEQPVSKVRKPVLPASETLADKLRRLGSEAEQAWQSGDPVGAESRHREIITLAPTSRAADLSYGDLFTLARQRSGPEQEISLWKEYLAAFPRGRYADDARAGLCRRADVDQRAACWQQYLTDFPAGVHRTQAERAQITP